MGWRRVLAALVGGLLLAGCAVKPQVAEVGRMCGFRMAPVGTAQPDPVPPEVKNLAKPSSERMLLMSGGGEDGAFGAGLLAQWSALNGGHLPSFRKVTGISTGAMLATFAFIDRPDVLARDYAIAKEGQLLRPFARLDAKGNPTVPSYLGIARHDALGDLTPLAAILTRDLTKEVLTEVAVRSRAGATLLVGAVDVDSGDAVAFDLGRMAERAVGSGTDADLDFYRSCYVNAVLASSSQPPLAPPIFIDNREYIDGGARFGVFADGFGRVAGLPSMSPRALHAGSSEAASSAPAAGETVDPVAPRPTPPTLFIIMNGTQFVAAHCGKLAGGGGACPADPLDPSNPEGADPSDNFTGAHDSWSLIPLAMRSSQILINQIDLFSVDYIYDRYRQTYGSTAGRILFMPILARDAGDPAELAAYRECLALHQADDRETRPIEFHPRYMRCLIGYGRTFATNRAKPLHDSGGEIAVP